MAQAKHALALETAQGARPAATARTTDWLSREVLVGGLRVADALLVVVAGIAALPITGISFAEAPITGWALVLGSLLAACSFKLAGTYRVRHAVEMRGQLVRLLVTWAGCSAVLYLLAAITGTRDDLPADWLALWLFAAAVSLAAMRLLVGSLVESWQAAGRLSRNCVVVGAGDQGRRLVEHLRGSDGSVRLIGLFDDRRDRVPEFVAGYPVLGTIDDMLAFARRNRVDEVLVALPWGAEGRLLDCLHKLRGLAADVRLCSDMIGFHLPHRGISHVAGVPTLHVFDRPLNGWARIVKAIEDRTIAALALLFLAPLLLVIALAVRLSSPGPALYRQKRWGVNNEVIEVLKFRTMHAAAASDGTEPELTHTQKNDPRVTPLGRWLRRTSLDELPQLINVLKGEMSLVGPRPHAVAHNERYAQLIERYPARHRVKPGITGWAQINGLRGEIETVEQMEKRVEYDLYYIQHWSLGFDLRILLRTVLHGFDDPQAY